MKLIKSGKQFTNEFVKGALDIYEDIECGNECGEDNAWIVLANIGEYLSIPNTTLKEAFSENQVLNAQKAVDVIPSGGQIRKSIVVS